MLIANFSPALAFKLSWSLTFSQRINLVNREVKIKLDYTSFFREL